MHTYSGPAPRLFPPPVFNHLQHANTVRKDLEDLVTCVDIRKTDSRHTGMVADTQGWW